MTISPTFNVLTEGEHQFHVTLNLFKKEKNENSYYFLPSVILKLLNYKLFNMSSYTGSNRPTKRFKTTTPAGRQHKLLCPERA